MAKLLIFSATLLALGTADIAAMRRKNLIREMVPYVLIAASAGVMAFLLFTDGPSLIGHVSNLLRGIGV